MVAVAPVVAVVVLVVVVVDVVVVGMFEQAWLRTKFPNVIEGVVARVALNNWVAVKVPVTSKLAI